MRLSLETVLGLNRNKRGSKRFSFGLVVIVLKSIFGQTLCLVKMLLDSTWEAKNRHTQSWLGEKRDCVKICVCRV